MATPHKTPPNHHRLPPRFERGSDTGRCITFGWSTPDTNLTCILADFEAGLICPYDVLPVVNGQVPILQSEFKSFLLILRTNKWLFGGNSASETGIMERATNCGSGRLRWDLFGNIFQSPAPFLFHNVLETSVITFGKFF